MSPGCIQYSVQMIAAMPLVCLVFISWICVGPRTSFYLKCCRNVSPNFHASRLTWTNLFSTELPERPLYVWPRHAPACWIHPSQRHGALHDRFLPFSLRTSRFFAPRVSQPYRTPFCAPFHSSWLTPAHILRSSSLKPLLIPKQAFTLLLWVVAQLVKNLPVMQKTGFNPCVEKIPWRRDWLPTPVFWPGEFHGLYSPWGCKVLDTTEQLSLSEVLEQPMSSSARTLTAVYYDHLWSHLSFN